jgi:hypothetical protein
MDSLVIKTGRDGPSHFWRVGRCLFSAYPVPSGWDVCDRNPDWGDTELHLDRRFATADEALDWCTNMALVFAEDQANDHDSL